MLNMVGVWLFDLKTRKIKEIKSAMNQMIYRRTLHNSCILVGRQVDRAREVAGIFLIVKIDGSIASWKKIYCAPHVKVSRKQVVI